MGRFEKRPDNPRNRSDLSRAAENALWDVVEDLENLQQNLLKSLHEDVKRLEAEKSRLAADIQRLTSEKENLQQTKQISEQQVLIRQLAEVLAKHISSQLQSSLKTLANQKIESASSNAITIKSAEANNHGSSEISQDVSQMLDHLDDTITIVFTSLQKELKNYQSNLSQQLLRMHEQQQQGEAILSKFVSHLQEELEKPQEITSFKAVTGGMPTVLQSHKNGSLEKSSERVIVQSVSLATQEPAQSKIPSTPNKVENLTVLPTSGENITAPDSALSLDSSEGPIPTTLPSSENPIEPISVLIPNLLEEPTLPEQPSGENVTEPISVLNQDLSENSAATPPLVIPVKEQEKTSKLQESGKSSQAGSIQLGFLFVALSAVISSLYNIAIKAIFHKGVEILAELAPTLGNIFLILMLRLLVVVPLMVLLAPILHSKVWQDLQNLFAPVGRKTPNEQAKTKQVLLLSFLSSCFLFSSQVLIYVSISQVATGIATTLFFIYPVITVLVSWFLWRDRPTLLITWAIAVIFCGELLMLGSSSTRINNSILGSMTGIMSGIAFAGYVILTRLCATKLHPVTFTLINFVTMLFLSFICLMVPLPGDVNSVINTTNLLEIVLSAFILGVLTLCSYLLNNFGVRQLGGLRSAVIGTIVPILTVIFAGLILQETLDIVQIMGVLLVCFGGAAISFEKMQNQVKPGNLVK